jgi:GNAT superfamily N-acetyltransferase
MALDARDARSDDYDAFVRLFLELGVPDPTPSRKAWDRHVRAHTFFVWEGGAPVGYVFWQKIETLARLMHVVVGPEARGRGVGGALMREMAARAKAAGCARWTLNVRPDNVPALRLYERHGMHRGQPWWSMEIAWDDVARLPAGDVETESFVVVPDEDARVEEAAGVPAGILGTLRAAGGRVFLGVRRAGAVVGLAAFDPSFPGAMPFVAREPWIARRVLEAMRPHARPGDERVRFAAESEATRDASVAAGARVMVSIVKMDGAIP